jgi:hypothetical protein
VTGDSGDGGLDGSGGSGGGANSISDCQTMIGSSASPIICSLYPRPISGSGGGVGCARCCGWISGGVKGRCLQVVTAGNHCDDQLTCLSGGQGGGGDSGRSDCESIGTADIKGSG